MKCAGRPALTRAAAQLVARRKFDERSTAPFSPVNTSESGSAPVNSPRCARSAATAAAGRVTTRALAADLGGPNSIRLRSCATLRGTRTVAASRSTSQRRSADSSPTADPLNAATRTKATNRGGISSARPNTWSTLATGRRRDRVKLRHDRGRLHHGRSRADGRGRARFHRHRWLRSGGNGRGTWVFRVGGAVAGREDRGRSHNHQGGPQAGRWHAGPGHGALPLRSRRRPRPGMPNPQRTRRSPGRWNGAMGRG